MDEKSATEIFDAIEGFRASRPYIVGRIRLRDSGWTCDVVRKDSRVAVHECQGSDARTVFQDASKKAKEMNYEHYKNSAISLISSFYDWRGAQLNT